tara:strand:+ start:330 stop:533 length:204 start_codon:yes stop_codon:yes gene_type:complete
MNNHKEDLMLIAQSITRELEENAKDKREGKNDFIMVIEGVLPCLLRNCHELDIIDSVKLITKIVEKK